GDVFELRNLLDHYPGRGGPKGDAFDRTAARTSFLDIMMDAGRDDAAMVLLGWNVARVAGVPRRIGYYQWTYGRWAVFPHPSGVSHYWNDPDNVRRARRFMRALVKEARS